MSGRRFPLTRRRFAFWLGMGLFSLAERLQAEVLDDVAAFAMRSASADSDRAEDGARPVHWTAAENNTWRWFERENFVDGKWKLSGVTTPVHKQTGERYEGREGYLDERLVPPEIRTGESQQNDPRRVESSAGQPSDVRRARHGRPPSRWLRSLRADELRIWLPTIEVPEAGVSGMTFWEHLTRDHSFNPDNIEGLTVDEQAKLHAAAHHGY